MGSGVVAGPCRVLGAAQVAEQLSWPVQPSRDPGFWVEGLEGEGRRENPEGDVSCWKEGPGLRGGRAEAASHLRFVKQPALCKGLQDGGLLALHALHPCPLFSPGAPRPSHLLTTLAGCLRVWDGGVHRDHPV